MLFSCIYSADREAFLLIGPMALEKMDVVELHQYYNAYFMKPDKEQELVVFTFSRVKGCSTVSGKEEWMRLCR